MATKFKNIYIYKKTIHKIDFITFYMIYSNQHLDLALCSFLSLTKYLHVSQSFSLLVGDLVKIK